MKRYLITILVFLVIILSIQLYLLNKIGQEYASTSTERNTPEQRATVPKVLYNLAGPAQVVGKDFIIFEARIRQERSNGQFVEVKDIRKAYITSNTKLTRLTFVSQAGTDQKMPKESDMTLGDIHLGDYIEVIAQGDISNKKEFEPRQVRLLPR